MITDIEEFELEGKKFIRDPIKYVKGENEGTYNTYLGYRQFYIRQTSDNKYVKLELRYPYNDKSLCLHGKFINNTKNNKTVNEIYHMKNRLQLYSIKLDFMNLSDMMYI